MLARSPEHEAHDKVLDNNPDRIGICWFLWTGENRSTWRKTLRERKRENNKLNDAGCGNRTRDTLVRGERSRHCATLAPCNNRLKRYTSIGDSIAKGSLLNLKTTHCTLGETRCKQEVLGSS